MRFSIFDFRFVMVALVALCACVAASAQEVAQEAQSFVTGMTGLSEQQQLYVTWGIIAAKYLSELYSSVRNGGGLRRIMLSFWFGENVPKPVAKDYEAELRETAPKDH